VGQAIKIQLGLAHGGKLIGHRLALLALNLNVGLAGVQTVDARRQRHDLRAIEVPVWRRRC
jgi:hypothetical protein